MNIGRPCSKVPRGVVIVGECSVAARLQFPLALHVRLYRKAIDSRNSAAVVATFLFLGILGSYCPWQHRNRGWYGPGYGAPEVSTGVGKEVVYSVTTYEKGAA